MYLKKKKWDKLLEKIYKKVICFEDDIIQMENRLAEKVDKLLAPYAGKYSEKQMEEFRAVIYEAIFAAEVKTFWIGVRYARRLSKRL